MLRALNVPLVITTVILGAASPALAANGSLTAAQIVDKNIAARGGLQKWRAVQSLSMSGKLDAGGNNQPALKIPGMPAPPPSNEPRAQAQLPFVLEIKRPNKTRLEIEFEGEKALQIYDGRHGWKLRPFLNRHQVENFTPEELKAAAEQVDLDGALIDYAASGTKISLEGMEKVEGKDAYKLKLNLKDGRVVREWLDAQSFLEVKIEGAPRKLDGKPRSVAIYLRDYRTVDGLQIPYLIETAVQGVARTEKIQVEKVVVNPRLDEARFVKPG